MGLSSLALESLQGFPAFISYLIMSLVLLGLFAWLYTACTPHKEFTLILQNQSSAAVAFGGALIGFVLPLASAISHSVSLFDCAIWGAIALVVQLSVFYVLRFFVRNLSQRIAEGEMASALFAGFVAIGVGLLNAACMSS